MNDVNPYKPYSLQVHFPLTDLDIVKILKGVEYSQIKYLPDGTQICFKVYSDDRVKHISWENWRHILAASRNNPDLERIIKFIETENEHGIIPV